MGEPIPTYHKTQAELSVASALRDLNVTLGNQAHEIVRRITAEAMEVRQGLPGIEEYAISNLYGGVAASIKDAGYDESMAALGPPTDKKGVVGNRAHISFNTSRLANNSQTSPTSAASHLAEELANNPAIADAYSIGAFVNLQCDFTSLAPRVMAEVMKLGSHYGHFTKAEPETTIIDYSSPNVAKNMTVAHLRSTIIGESLRRIHAATGDTVIGVNHIGDWGTQFGALLYSYLKEAEERGQEFLEEVATNPTSVLMRLYRQFTTDAKNDPELGDHARSMFLRLEKGDSELVSLWSSFRDWSLAAFEPIYEKLGVSFDIIQGESFYEDRMAPTVQKALEMGVLRVDERGAVVLPSQPLADPVTGKVNDKVMLAKDGSPRDELIVKPSGGTVYLTRDIAAIVYRAKELGATKVLYVIGKEQGNHCLELFAVSHQIGALAIGDAQHISFGHLNVNGRKMKSREGTVVLLSDLIDGAVETAAGLIRGNRSRRPAQSSEIESGEPNEDERVLARQLGISALIFNDLRQDRTKDIEFNPDELGSAVDEGSSIYIQYAHARLNSLLRNHVPSGLGSDFVNQQPVLTEIQEAAVMQLAQVPQIIQEAARSNAPHKIATFLSTICRTVNLLYSERKISEITNLAEREFAIGLMSSLKQSIENLSYLICIDLPGKL